MQNEFLGRKNEVESGFSGVAEEVEGFKKAEEKSEQIIKDIVNERTENNSVLAAPIFGEMTAGENDNFDSVKINSDASDTEVFDTVSNIMKETKDNPFLFNEKINNINKTMRGKNG